MIGDSMKIVSLFLPTAFHTRPLQGLYKEDSLTPLKSENKRHERLEFRVTHRVYQSCDSLGHSRNEYRSSTVNSKSFLGKILLRIKWKFEIN